MLREVRSRPAHRRRAAGRERGPGAADRPVVGQHVLQPAHRPRSFDDPAADDRHVPGDRQRRGAHPAAHHQGHHRRPTAPAPTSPGRTGCGWCRRKPRRPCGTCCARQCSATRWASSRAPARWLRSTATRSPARPAPRSRSTPAAAATTTTSTGSPSPAWPPPTIPATSSASWPTTRNARPTASPARRWRRCSTTSPPGCCSGRTCRCRPTRGRR